MQNFFLCFFCQPFSSFSLRGLRRSLAIQRRLLLRPADPNRDVARPVGLAGSSSLLLLPALFLFFLARLASFLSHPAASPPEARRPQPRRCSPSRTGRVLVLASPAWPWPPSGCARSPRPRSPRRTASRPPRSPTSWSEAFRPRPRGCPG